MSVFIAIPKKVNVKECSNYHTFVLISHAIIGRPCSKSFKLDFSSTYLRTSRFISSVRKRQRNQRLNCWHWLDLEKGRQFKENVYCSCVDHKNWKVHKEMGIPDHLTCLLRSLYPGQKATVRTRHGTMNWFKTVKRVGQRLCNLYVTLLIKLVCRVHHEKCWAGWSASWNQDCQEKYKQPQICRWHHPYGRKWRGTQKPLYESEKVSLKLNI